jgi:hypothetical protein
MDSDYEQEIKQNRLFILGAGFSASAGIPMIGKLLSDSMKLFSRECPGIFCRVNHYAQECFSADGNVDYTKIKFADLCTFLDYIELSEYGGGERWSDNGSREKIAFKFYLSKSIANTTPTDVEIPDLYLQFAKQLRKYDVIITFNWDTLLEMALMRIGKTFAYNNQEEADVYIYKFHGSINWRLTSFNGAKFNWRPLGFTKGMMKDELFYCNELLNKDSWRGLPPLLGEAEPFIILPGSGKAYEVRPLAPIWYKPGIAFAFTHDVFIIGLSLSDDDFFIRSFFLDTLPFIEHFSGVPGRTITIINPDSSIEKNYSFIQEHKSVQFIFEKFNMNHIQFM